VKLSILARDPAAADLELIVSPRCLDFIIHHLPFRPFPPRRWHLHGLSVLTGSICRNRR
jgi:hypothetical protein